MNLREAAEQALHFMDNCDLADAFNPPTAKWGLDCREALRAALAEQAEPVAWQHESGHLADRISIGHNDPAALVHRGWRPLYTAPAAPAAPQPPAWIPVERELPPRETDVLVLVTQEYGTHRRLAVAGIFPSDGTALTWGWFSYEQPERELTVTHWMPLPEPPTGSKT